MTTLSLQYSLLRTRANQRTSVLGGIASVSVDDHVAYDLTLSQGESHTFVVQNLLVLAPDRPLAVEVTFSAQQVVEMDVNGFLYLPAPCTAVVSNPVRFGYTSPIPLSAVTA